MKRHRARPWWDPEDTDHVECLVCSEPVTQEGASWRHAGGGAEEAASLLNRPLPIDAAMFDAAVNIATAAVRDLPPGTDDQAKVYAVIDILYWRGAFRLSGWRRPDARVRRIA
jgi:hypothetical protein